VVAGLSNTVIGGSNDYASSAFDVRQSFSGALTYSLPGFTKSSPVTALSKGWSLAAVAIARSGFPFNANILSLASITGGYAYSRPDRVAGQPAWISNANAGGGRSLNPNAFQTPSTLRQGTESRNDIGGFPLRQVDLSLGRDFAFTEKLKLQFRADAFNVVNHPNFANPAALIGFGPTYLESTQMLNSALGGLNPLFQEGGPRSLQLSLKLTF